MSHDIFSFSFDYGIVLSLKKITLGFSRVGCADITSFYFYSSNLTEKMIPFSYLTSDLGKDLPFAFFIIPFDNLKIL